MDIVKTIDQAPALARKREGDTITLDDGTYRVMRHLPADSLPERWRLVKQSDPAPTYYRCKFDPSFEQDQTHQCPLYYRLCHSPCDALNAGAEWVAIKIVGGCP